MLGWHFEQGASVEGSDGAPVVVGDMVTVFGDEDPNDEGYGEVQSVTPENGMSGYGNISVDVWDSNALDLHGVMTFESDMFVKGETPTVSS
jgi:hypothetical protein